MALVLRNLYNFYDYYFNDYVDDRIKDLYLLQSPWPVIAIVAVYLFFVTGKGQHWMKDRKAFELSSIINAYNIAQIVLNLYMGFGVMFAMLQTENLNVFCIPAPWNDYTAAGLKILHYSYVYLLLKIMDLCDTMFFILRKKNNQVTFLHIYHHAVMVLGCYGYIKFMSGGGHALVLGVVNSFVHVIMYFYYWLTTFKPELKKSIWWKKYITQVQMAQFAILIFHFGVPVFTSCSYPKGLNAGIAVQNIFMLLLFGDFYYKAYVKKKN